MTGWIKLYRKLMDNPYYFAEKFCRGMAWIDLLLLANHEDGIFFKRGIKVEVKRGQLGYDIETLSKRWKWSRGKVERWLFELEKSRQIARQKNNVTTIITITNYEEYQGVDKANDKPNSKPNDKADSKANGHEQEYKEEYKNGKNVIPPTLEMVIDYCKERNNKIDPQQFIDWNEARGWMLNGRKMKNWQAAIRTWESRGKDLRSNNGSFVPDLQNAPQYSQRLREAI